MITGLLFLTIMDTNAEGFVQHAGSPVWPCIASEGGVSPNDNTY